MIRKLTAKGYSEGDWGCSAHPIRSKHVISDVEYNNTLSAWMDDKQVTSVLVDDGITVIELHREWKAIQDSVPRDGEAEGSRRAEPIKELIGRTSTDVPAPSADISSKDNAANEAAYNTARRMGKQGSTTAALKAASEATQTAETMEDMATRVANEAMHIRSMYPSRSRGQMANEFRHFIITGALWQRAQAAPAVLSPAESVLEKAINHHSEGHTMGFDCKLCLIFSEWLNWKGRR